MGAHLTVHTRHDFKALPELKAFMKYTRFLTALLLASSLLTSHAGAQVVATPTPAAKTDEPTAEQLELERKALALLDEVIGETPSLKLVENRIRIQETAAEILWPRDQARARELFNTAAVDLAAMTSGIESDDPQYYNLTNAASQFRQRMLTNIAQYDAKFALEFLRATRQAPPPVQPGTNFRQPDQELMLEAQLAQQIAARDPQQALRMAEEILNRGLSSNLMPLLDQLRTRDPEGANRLTSGIVKKLRTASFATDYEATNIANYLLVTTRPPENTTNASGQMVAVNQSNPRRLQLDEQARRELITSMVSAALNSSNNPAQAGNVGGLLSTVRQLMPEVERYVPAQAAGVRRRLEGYERRTESGGNPREYRQVMESGTTEAMLEAATKASPEMRQQLYRTAAWKAFNEGNVERARQIINTNIDGARQREQFLKELDQQLFWRAVSEGNVEGAQGLLARIKSTDERVSMLLQLARATFAKGNVKAATGFLDDAWELIGGRARGHSQFSSQLQLAHTYAQVAPARGFEIIEASIAHLNELVAAAAVLDGFGQEAFAQDELKSQEGYVWGSLAVQASDALAALAPADFDHARSAADRFQRPELRLQARLAIARSVLLKKEGERNRNTLQRRGRGVGGVGFRINQD